MSTARLCILGMVTLVGFSWSTNAQTAGIDACADTVRIDEPPNRVLMGFEKNLTTYLWQATVEYRKQFETFSIDAMERFRSTLIQTPKKLIRDDQMLDVKANQRFGERLGAVVLLNSFIISDERRIGVSDASSHGAYGGLNARLFESVYVEPLLGIRFDDQVGRKDRGVSYILGAGAPHLDFDGYRTQIHARLQHDQLDPRTTRRHHARVGIEKNFTGRSRNVFCTSYGFNQRDFYTTADSTVMTAFAVTHNIERRAERVFHVSNLVEYEVGDRIMLRLQGNLLSRGIDQTHRYRPVPVQRERTLLNTSISEFRVGSQFEARYNVADKLLAAARFHYSERDERHAVETDERVPDLSDRRSRDEARKNNLTRRSTLGVDASAALSPSDRLLFSASSSLLRYDTPSEENVEDRDELWHSFNVTTLHQLNPVLHLRLSADVNLTHLVYLFRERSANNNWNRVLRLSPRLHYTPSSFFRTTNTFEVLANYTVYDFEDDPTVQVQSFSFRQFSWMDSTRIDMTTRLALETYWLVRLYERGELRWDTFRERPLNSFEDKTAIAQVQYRLNHTLLFSVGVRYFSQIRFGYIEGKRFLESRLTSVGPLGGVQWDAGPRSSIVIHGWYEEQTLTHSPTRGFANMTMALNIHL